MPKTVNCCVRGCTNNFRNNLGLTYYRIPKDRKLRRRYEILIRSATLKAEADNTRICEQHEGGIKKSRYDLPSIFPWSKPVSTCRVLKRFSPEEVKKSSKKPRRAFRPSPPAADTRTESELNTELPLATNEQDGYTDFCGPVHDKLAEESQTHELQTHVEFGTQTYEPQPKVEGGTQTLEPHAKVEFRAQTELINLRFDIDQYKEKDSDIAFYTGFPNYKTLMLCYDMVKDSAKKISYGSHERRNFDCPAVLQPGRPRALTT